MQTISGKGNPRVYVGQTSGSALSRFGQHIDQANRAKAYSPEFHTKPVTLRDYIQWHGDNDLAIMVLEKIDLPPNVRITTKDFYTMALPREDYWIDIFDSRRHGYNTGYTKPTNPQAAEITKQIVCARFNAGNVSDATKSGTDELPNFSDDSDADSSDSDESYTPSTSSNDMNSNSDHDAPETDGTPGRTYGSRVYARRIKHLHTRVFPSWQISPSVTISDAGYLL